MIPDLEQEEDQKTTGTLFLLRRDRSTVSHEHQIEELEQQAVVGLAGIAVGDCRRYKQNRTSKWELTLER